MVTKSSKDSFKFLQSVTISIINSLDSLYRGRINEHTRSAWHVSLHHTHAEVQEYLINPRRLQPVAKV